MNKLPTFDSRVEDAHESSLRDLIGSGLLAVDVSQFSSNQAEQKYLVSYLEKVREYVFERRCLVAKAEVLGEIVVDVENHFFNWEKIIIDSPIDRLNAHLAGVFGYSRFRDRKGRGENGWGGEVLIRKLLKAVRYCPYCNAETVYAIEMENAGEGKPPLIKVAFDHFFPKGRYPFLSVSLYNLIPSCYRCNSQFKIAQYKELCDTLHPYVHSIDDLMRFMPGAISAPAWISVDEDANFDILFVPKATASEEDAVMGKNFAKLFQIERVYSQLYSREAIAMLQKCRVFDDEYLRQIESWFSAAGLHNVDIRGMVFNTSFDRVEINKYRISKMLNDMRDFWLN